MAVSQQSVAVELCLRYNVCVYAEVTSLNSGRGAQFVFDTAARLASNRQAALLNQRASSGAAETSSKICVVL
jgi:hypothetical protein